MNKKACKHIGFLAHMRYCGKCGEELNKNAKPQKDCFGRHEGYHIVGKHNFCPDCGKRIN